MTVKHPAKYPEAVLQAMAKYVDGARIIADRYAGTCRIGWIRRWLTEPPVCIAANELEPEWAASWHENGCDQVRIGDARTMSKDYGLEWAHAIAESITFGNRIADSCDWQDDSKRITYHSYLGRPLSPGSSANLQWTDPAWCQHHRESFADAWALLVPGGRYVLNIKDHQRDGRWQRVPEWCVAALLGVGFKLLDWVEVEVPSHRHGANHEARAEHELVICFEKPVERFLMDRGPLWARAIVPYEGYRRQGHLWDLRPELPQLGLPL